MDAWCYAITSLQTTWVWKDFWTDFLQLTCLLPGMWTGFILWGCLLLDLPQCLIFFLCYAHSFETPWPHSIHDHEKQTIINALPPLCLVFWQSHGMPLLLNVGAFLWCGGVWSPLCSWVPWTWRGSVTSLDQAGIWTHVWSVLDPVSTQPFKRILRKHLGALITSWVPHLRVILLNGNKAKGGVTRRIGPRVMTFVLNRE